MPDESALRHETLDSFLEKLTARTPTPAGGATAALHAAQAAALLGMVARYSTGPKYAAVAQTAEWVLAEADILRAECTDLIAADAAAFGSVATAYALPKDTVEEKAARSAAIAAALVTAAEPPAAVIAAATRLLDLAEALRPVGNRTVLSDLAAAAAWQQYSEVLAEVDTLLARAEAVSEAVRAGLQQ